MRKKRIEIPSSLYKKIEKRIKGTEFKTVSEWVTYALKELVEDLEKEEEISEEEEELIKQRLRALGYL